MTDQEAWNKILFELAGKELDFPTVPKTNRTPVWFNASTDGKIVFINMALDNKPSSQLLMQRKLNYKTFQKVYPLFIRRERGEKVSSEVTVITVDQVYYFSLMKHLC